ncbi:MAG: hypothetical protein E7176_02840 [Erysipelotrichaceae bacterium]|nr:hypothetical protein [Erysipelotrichaceae bacterium]
MKTKIFVCSNSAIDYVSHNSNISPIPVRIIFSDEEQYEDYIDFSTDAFYNRIRLDKKARVRTEFKNYSDISDSIQKAKKQGYEQVLFIIPPKDFSNLYVSISIAISENKDILCHIYNADTILYPLAYMAIEANNMFTKGASLDDVIKRLDFINKNHFICFFTHKYNESRLAFNKNYKKGKVKVLENGELVTLENERGLPGYKKLLKLLDIEYDDREIIPFLLYTSKSSRYVELLEEDLLAINPIFKKLKMFPIAPAIGYQLGPNTIGVGFIYK